MDSSITKDLNNSSFSFFQILKFHNIDISKVTNK